MTYLEEKDYIKAAYQALIERGVITEDMLSPSTVTDEMLDSFEQEFDVKLPSILRTYLKTYCHNIYSLRAPVPMDDICGVSNDVMRQIQSMSSKEIKELDEEERPYLGLWWCQMLPIPKKDPLKYFRDIMEGYREIIDYLEDSELTLEDIKQFVPFADWQGAGALCFDMNRKEENIDLENPDTWQICWFDHEEFNWEEAAYIDDEGIVTGDKIFPNFESFFNVYFYGIYDKLYDACWEEDGEEQPDKKSWCEAYSDSAIDMLAEI